MHLFILLLNTYFVLGGVSEEKGALLFFMSFLLPMVLLLRVEKEESVCFDIELFWVH